MRVKYAEGRGWWWGDARFVGRKVETVGRSAEREEARRRAWAEGEGGGAAECFVCEEARAYLFILDGFEALQGVGVVLCRHLSAQASGMRIPSL